MCTLIITDEEKNSQRRITRISCRGRYKENAISISTSIYLTKKEVLEYGYALKRDSSRHRLIHGRII